MTQETTNKRAKYLIKKIKELGNELIKSKLIHKYEYDIDGDDESDDYDDWWIIFHLCIPEYNVGNVLVSDVKKAYEKTIECKFETAKKALDFFILIGILEKEIKEHGSKIYTYYNLTDFGKKLIEKIK